MMCTRYDVPDNERNNMHTETPPTDDERVMKRAHEIMAETEREEWPDGDTPTYWPMNAHAAFLIAVRLAKVEVFGA